MQRLQVQLIVGLHRNAACRWPLYGFRDRVGVSEVVLVALTKRLGISWRHLLYFVTERDQLSGNIMCCHSGLDANQAPRRVGKPCYDPAARDLLAQNDCTLLIQANQMQRVLTCIDANRGNYSVCLAGHSGVLLVLLSPRLTL